MNMRGVIDGGWGEIRKGGWGDFMRLTESPAQVIYEYGGGD